jgi:DMSO/TMAO reductase YedYZ molybdopterin-dependent catalytic subunit
VTTPARPTQVETTGPQPTARRWRRYGLGAVIGLLSAGLAIGVGEFVTAFVRPAAAPIVVVGNRIILLTPEPVRLWAIHRFGTNDKPALLTGIYLGIAVLAVVVGIIAIHRFALGLLGIAAFGAIGVYCALTTHAHRTSDVIPTLFGTVAALAAMIVLVRAVVGEDAGSPSRTGPLVADRRRFLQAGVITGFGAAATSLIGGATVASRYDVGGARARVALPAPASPAPPLANGTDLGKSPVRWITPLTGSAALAFYRVDTAISVPQINPAHWKLRIHGMVDRPISLSYADLLARPLIERWITLACVSREVQGDLNNLIGTARFLGAPLADVLREAGVQSGADQLVCRSSDGMTIGAPTAAVMDGRDALLAVGMDGQPLPIEHGFPVRMVVPGLYGYVSACKWIVDIEATTFSRFNAYWVEAGWVQQAPVIVSSRIDTPQSSAQLRLGQAVAVAGVAWDQHVGISKVEVQVDSGAWAPARLARVPSLDTWQQWVWTWTPTTAGLHTLRVRATDRAGQVQDGRNAGPFPGPATGWHTISVNVRG